MPARMTYETLVLYAARAFESAGIVVMLAGAVVAMFRYVSDRSYHELRRRIANAILLGLELLIAADIIATVTVRPTIESVAALGAIVLIRTFLSFSLELEATGRWPWQRADSARREPTH